jgi:predicted esterase
MIWGIPQAKGGIVNRKTVRLMLCILFLMAILAACAKQPQVPEVVDTTPAVPQETQVAATPTSIGMIKPGDSIGEMIVEQSSEVIQYPNMWIYCDYPVEAQEPNTITKECEIPYMSGMTISIGWGAIEEMIASNWEAMNYDIFLDGYRLDLESFEWVEFAAPWIGENVKGRNWLINIKHLAVGQHTLRYTWSSSQAVDDGMNVYQPGTYEQIVKFSVLEPETYPELLAEEPAGQHAYTSQKSQLNFLLYLPSDYGKNPQAAWPMLVFLHDNYVRGGPPDLLKEELLPKKLEEQADFPFLVVSPILDGNYEFWAEDDMINSVLTLLEEVQGVLSVDAKRIYLIGDGAGGNGVWEMGLNHPEIFAALAPIGGSVGYPFEVPDNICNLKDVPVWAFHGGKDPYVPVEVEQDLVDALNACGGNAQITVKLDATDNIREEAYANPELYDWFLSQSHK